MRNCVMKCIRWKSNQPLNNQRKYSLVLKGPGYEARGSTCTEITRTRGICRSVMVVMQKCNDPASSPLCPMLACTKGWGGGGVIVGFYGNNETLCHIPSSYMVVILHVVKGCICNNNYHACDHAKFNLDSGEHRDFLPLRLISPPYNF